jgi:pimeloyl-ACP methyl ester carboxylesterase
MCRVLPHAPAVQSEPDESKTRGSPTTARRRERGIVKIAKPTVEISDKVRLNSAASSQPAWRSVIRTSSGMSQPSAPLTSSRGFRPDLVRLQRGLSVTPSPELAKLLPTEADIATWRASFQRSAPDPTALDSILERLNAMLAAWPGWTADELRAIGAPTLVAIGDND